MLKTRILLLLSLAGFSSTANAQLADYYGAWVSERDDMLLIYDTTYTKFTRSITDMHDLLWRMNVEILGDTLRFWKKIDKPGSSQEYDFSIVEKDEKLLRLYPISKLSQNSFGFGLVTFRKQPLIEEPFHFEKIAFIDSCRGHYNPCARSFLQVTSDKTIELTKINEDWGKDAGKVSFYKDQLHDSTFSRLIYLLQTAAFNRYQYHEKYHPLKGRHINSRSIKSYNLSYNNKKLAFSTPVPGPTLFELNWLFYQLCHEYELQEIDTLDFKLDRK